MTTIGRRRRLVVVAISVGAVVLAVAALVMGVRVLYAGEALPGTKVAGIAMSGASVEEIRRRLTPVAQSDAPITVDADGQRLHVRPSETGYEVDLEASVYQTLDAGRTGTLGGALSTLKGLALTRHVPLVAKVDTAKLQRTVATLANRIDRPSFAGQLDITPATMEVGVEPPRAGRRVDRRVLMARLRDALFHPTTRQIEVAVARRPVTSRTEVEDVARAAAEYLQQPLVLDGAGPPLRVQSKRIARLLALEPLAGGRDARLGVDRNEVATLVGRVADKRDRPALSARVTAPVRQAVLDGKEDLAWSPRAADVDVRPSRPGREVDQQALASSIEDAVREDTHQSALPMQRVDPAVTTRQARGVNSLIGTFTTYYEPAEPRVTNIRRIAESVDGTVVAPGEQFSLNGVAGQRTRDKGYVPAPFIADGKIIPSVGGGVSQFSTTMYNAAYFAGLQIDGHQPHSLFIDRYPAGREATLNYPDIDLVWTNDTASPVVVRASGGATSVSVSLYGDNGGRRVRAETESREPLVSGDFAIVVTRVVHFADGRTERQSHTTSYDLPEE